MPWNGVLVRRVATSVAGKGVLWMMRSNIGNRKENAPFESSCNILTITVDLLLFVCGLSFRL